MAERTSPAGSAFAEPSRTFPERENPHGRGRGCPDAFGGNRGLGGEARALPTGPLRSVHHPDPHTDGTTVRGRHHTRHPRIPSGRDPIVTHLSLLLLEAPGDPAGPDGASSLMWKTHASNPQLSLQPFDSERPFESGKAGERRRRVARGGLGNGPRILLAHSRDLGDREHDVGRLVVVAPKRLRSEER